MKGIMRNPSTARRLLAQKAGAAALLASTAALAIFAATCVGAEQIDIAGPPGSGKFGQAVAVLPNGNFVVADPFATVAGASGAGAVYLFTPAGDLISTLTGSTPGDRVGYSGIYVLANGNFVVASSSWNNGAASEAGAVTWVDGEAGLAAAVSASNSLVGSQTIDRVGEFGVALLSNGNYVVVSPSWNSGSKILVGAATWGNGSAGVKGPVSADNSLIGSSAGDQVGYYGVAALANGNYVVTSPFWNNGEQTEVGAATWADGTVGISGAVSVGNSLVGSSAGDSVGVGHVTALSNGNYVVVSPNWSNGAVLHVGAATFANGASGLTGMVTVSNSLIGTTEDDAVGSGSNNGSSFGAVALTNGNYVVRSSDWHNGPVAGAGAATWCNGITGCAGTVSSANSLVGTSTDDHISYSGVTALTNGNYVVASHYWHGDDAFEGAATWANGTVGTSGPVSAANSLVGTSYGDIVAYGGVIALANGNYVVSSFEWSGTVGAATWGDGAVGLTGFVSESNSLVGTTGYDHVGGWIAALSNGNYVVGSPNWTSPLAGNVGAVTWAGGHAALVGHVDPTNSFYGASGNDRVGIGRILAFGDGSYAVNSPGWQGTGDCIGAVTLASGNSRLTGTIESANSVLCTGSDQSSTANIAYDLPRHRLLVGRPGYNAVAIFRLDTVFSDSFD